MDFVHKIWIYWHQGEEAAPNLVRHCIASWRKQHPEWEVIVLDQNTLTNYIDLDWLPDDYITIQWLTDVARIELLRKYGGVWADATLYCEIPLENWLPAYLQDDFFVFESELRDRFISNWFIASQGNNPWIECWGEAVRTYSTAYQFSETKGLSKFYYRKVMSLRKRNLVGNNVWLNPLTTRVMKLRPYPMVMFLFEHMLNQQPELMEKWQQRRQFKDDVCHRVQNIFKMNNPCSPDVKSWLAKHPTPVHKLNWRQDSGVVPQGSNLEYLISANRNYL